MNWNFISQASSIITLILFVIYILGRIWIIYNKRKVNNECFKMLHVDEENQIAEYVNPDRFCDLGDNELSVFSADMYINKFKIYEIKYLDDYSHWEKVNTKPIYTYKGLNSNEKIYIKMNLPCGGPSEYLIEYVRCDYVKVSFIPSYNAFEPYILKHYYKSKMTFLGYLYYFFN